MNASLPLMNAFQLATSTSNMSVGVDHLASTLIARCSLAKRLPVKDMSKYVAVLDATGEVCPLASLADKTKGEARNCLACFNFE
jgi:hypothetical protein